MGDSPLTKPRNYVGRLCKWRHTYTIRQEKKYEGENKSHMETMEEFNPDEDIVSLFFLHNAEESERCTFRTEKLRSFLTDPNLYTLPVDGGDARAKFIAVVDQRSKSDASSRGSYRVCKGPLTAIRLDEELKRKVRWNSPPNALGPLTQPTDCESSLLDQRFSRPHQSQSTRQPMAGSSHNTQPTPGPEPSIGGVGDVV